MDTAKAADCKLMIAYRAHFEPHNQPALQMKKDGAFRQRAAGDRRHDAPPLDHSRPRDERRARRDLTGGGSMMDIGIDAGNGTLYFLEEMPVALAASISNPAGEVRYRKVEDLMSVQLRLGRARRSLHRLHAAGEPHPEEMACATPR